MTRRVIDVGNCAADHASIRAWIESQFDATVEQCHDARQTLACLRQRPADLVLVNRILDADASQGLELIRRIKSDPDLAEAPVMMISNYVEHQQQAVEAGAEPGFGKLQVGQPAARDRLKDLLD